jgi:serine/threonine protein phosphatase PrpC
VPKAKNWPNIQIFGIFDGHGGSKCAEYLKEHLHNNIIFQPDFPTDIEKAIVKACHKTDEDFLDMIYKDFK